MGKENEENEGLTVDNSYIENSKPDTSFNNHINPLYQKPPVYYPIEQDQSGDIIEDKTPAIVPLIIGM